jgi:hypothetical protein
MPGHKYEGKKRVYKKNPSGLNQRFYDMNSKVLKQWLKEVLKDPELQKTYCKNTGRHKSTCECDDCLNEKNKE